MLWMKSNLRKLSPKEDAIEKRANDPEESTYKAHRVTEVPGNTLEYPRGYRRDLFLIWNQQKLACFQSNQNPALKEETRKFLEIRMKRQPLNHHKESLWELTAV